MGATKVGIHGVEADSFDVMPIMYEMNGTGYMSFNEVIFQISGKENETSTLELKDAVARVAGK